MNHDEYGKMFAAEDRYWWFVSRRRLAQRLIQRYAPQAEAILDVGCGTGAMLHELPRSAAGVDISQEALTFARTRGLERLMMGSATELPCTSGLFDLVVTLDTLEHVDESGRALAEISRVLRPGGMLIVNVPAYQWLWGPHDVALMHHRRYHRAMLRRELESAGLEPIRLTYSVFFLFPVVVVRRLFERRRRGPAEVQLPLAPGPLNSLLIGLMSFEAWLLERMDLPWGSSVVAVARKRVSIDALTKSR